MGSVDIHHVHVGRTRLHIGVILFERFQLRFNFQQFNHIKLYSAKTNRFRVVLASAD